MESKAAQSSLNSDSASSQMVMDELEKFENTSNASGTLSSDSSDLFQLKRSRTALHMAEPKTKIRTDTHLPSTRHMQQQLAELQNQIANFERKLNIDDLLPEYRVDAPHFTYPLKTQQI